MTNFRPQPQVIRSIFVPCCSPLLWNCSFLPGNGLLYIWVPLRVWCQRNILHAVVGRSSAKYFSWSILTPCLLYDKFEDETQANIFTLAQDKSLPMYLFNSLICCTADVAHELNSLGRENYSLSAPCLKLYVVYMYVKAGVNGIGRRRRSLPLFPLGQTFWPVSSWWIDETVQQSFWANYLVTGLSRVVPFDRPGATCWDLRRPRHVSWMQTATKIQ